MEETKVSKKIKVMAICTALLLIAIILVAVLAPRAFAAELSAAGAEVTVQAVDLTGVINAVLALIAAAITTFLIPWLRAKNTNEQNQVLDYWITVAVGAAEQIYNSKQGQAKKEYVLEFLAAKGYKVDSAQIEAKVKELFGKTEQAAIDDVTTAGEYDAEEARG